MCVCARFRFIFQWRQRYNSSGLNRALASQTQNKEEKWERKQARTMRTTCTLCMRAHVVPQLPNINLFAANERECACYFLPNKFLTLFYSRCALRVAFPVFSPRDCIFVFFWKIIRLFCSCRKIHFVKTYSLFVFIISPALLSTFRELQLCGGSVMGSFLWISKYFWLSVKMFVRAESDDTCWGKPDRNHKKNERSRGEQI